MKKALSFNQLPLENMGDIKGIIKRGHCSHKMRDTSDKMCDIVTVTSRRKQLLIVTSPLLVTTILMLSVIVRGAHGFNVDVNGRVKYSDQGSPESMFGFSVVGHKEGNEGW